MKRILITGASGMLAQALLGLLAEAPAFSVWAVSSKPPVGYPAHIHPVARGEEEACLQKQEFDCIVHAAFPRNVQAGEWADGIAYGHRVLFLARQYGVKSVIHISSQSLYGWDRTSPADEAAPLSLTGPYTTGKFCTEQVIARLFADVPHTNLRLATLIGPHSAERVPNRLLADLLAGRELRIQGGNQVFSFLHVADAADAIMAILTSPATRWRPVYNVGTEESHTLSDIAEMCVAAGDALGVCGAGIVTQPADIRLDNRLCCRAFYEDFGWRAKRSLADTLAEILAVAREKSV